MRRPRANSMTRNSRVVDVRRGRSFALKFECDYRVCSRTFITTFESMYSAHWYCLQLIILHSNLHAIISWTISRTKTFDNSSHYFSYTYITSFDNHISIEMYAIIRWCVVLFDWIFYFIYTIDINFYYICITIEIL